MSERSTGACHRTGYVSGIGDVVAVGTREEIWRAQVPPPQKKNELLVIFLDIRHSFGAVRTG